MTAIDGVREAVATGARHGGRASQEIGVQGARGGCRLLGEHRWFLPVAGERK